MSTEKMPGATVTLRQDSTGSTPQSLDFTLKPVSPGGYEITGELGRGGMGIVYSARDLALDRDVAIKVLQAGHEPGSTIAQRFLEEARITGQLQHPGIPAIHQVGTLPDGRPFLAMKLIKGQTLQELLERRPTPEVDRGRFLAVFEAICQAVGYAHAHRIIHRDLKPHNIMVGSFGETQVMDWGLAKVLGKESLVPGSSQPAAETLAYTDIRSHRSADSATMAGSMLGTPAFMPPEQAGGEIQRIDTRADVFGLGAILCVILTGKPPYVAADAETLRLAAIRGNLGDALARLDACGAEREWIALAKSCLAYQPVDRPADAAALAQTAASLRAEAEARAQRAELERARAEVQAAEQRKRRKVQRALAAAVVTVVALLGAGVWYMDRLAGERRALATRNLQAAELALDQADVALRKDNPVYGEIDAALTQAQERLAFSHSEELSQRYASLAADRRMLEQLDEIDARRWLAGGDNRLKLDTDYALSTYPQRFQEHGLALATTPARPLAQQIRRSPIAPRLTAALNFWLALGGPPEVRELLDELDPDPERRALRAAFEAKDVALIAAQTAKLDGRLLPPEFAQLVGAHPLTPQEHAIRILTGAQAVHVNHFGLANQTARRFRDDQADERIMYYRVALSLRPTNAICWNNLGAALHVKRDLNAALAAYQEAIRLDPKNPRSHLGLGGVYYDKKDLTHADAEFQEVIRLEPSFGIGHINRGQILRDRNNLDGALAEYREAQRLEPKSIVALQHIGHVFLRKNDLDSAIQVFREAVQSDPKAAGTWNDLGNALSKKKDWDGAIAAFRQTTQLEPRFYPAYNSLSLALASRGQPREAMAVLQAGVKVNPAWLTNSTTWFRYNLVCCSLMAASGQGKDAPDASARATLQRQARDWLNDDLAFWRGAWQSDPVHNRAVVHQKMTHWLRDADLASVREGRDVPETERVRWQKLWEDVRRLSKETE